MNDRFKFRIFINNKIQEVFYFYKSKNGVIFACTDLENDTGFNIDGSTLMQCTGLKDKNGKLIFEGDIIEFNSDFNGRIRGMVYFDEMELQIKAKLFYSSNFSQPYADRDLKYFSDQYFIKVIGNKFENPELLKECENE